jgi:hypothetical protein
MKIDSDDPFFGLEDTRTEEQKKQDQKRFDMFIKRSDRLFKIESLFPECFDDHTDGHYTWKTKK